MSRVRILVRRGSSAQWAAADPVLGSGEIGYDETLKILKIGDGSTAWSSLGALGGGGGGSWGSITGTLDAQTDLTAYIAAQLASLVDSAPGALDTLAELAAALGDDADFAGTVTTALAGKVAASLVDAKGDLLVGTADNAVGRLPVGSAGQLLTPDSGETTGLVWSAPGEAPVNVVAATGATETLSAASVLHDVTMDQNCTFTFTSPAEGAMFAVILRGAFTPTFPASVDWPDGTPPTYSAPALYVFSTFDGGTTWLGVQSGKAFA